MADRESQLTSEVLERFAGTASPRLRELLDGLVRHLHDYAREVRLSEAEWASAIDFLTRTGQITTASRQEFILLSDVLGPFFVRDAPFVEFGGDVAQGAAGEPCWVEGTVTATDGSPVPHAEIEVWEADEDGFYDVQYDDGRTAGRARLRADERGRYGFWSVKPAPYPIPHDGPVGELLVAARRSPMRPAHIHFMVAAPGCHTLVTHVFAHDSEHLDDDAVFGVKPSLIREFEEMNTSPPASGPSGRTLDSRWWRLVFDVVLAPA